MVPVLTIVRSRTPVSNSAWSNMPGWPSFDQPPTSTIMPSRTPASASCADANRLSTAPLQHAVLPCANHLSRCQDLVGFGAELRQQVRGKVVVGTGRPREQQMRRSRVDVLE